LYIWNRRSFISLISGACCAVPQRTLAQPSTPIKPPRIGYLATTEPTLNAAFTDELTKLGYIDGRNIIIETHSTATELAHMDLELVVVPALPSALLVRQTNPLIPMVIGTAPGMVSNGFAESLEHPGGNVTGMDELPPGVTARRLNLLRTAAPIVTRIGLLSTTPGTGGHETQLADAQQTAVSLGITVKPYRVTSLDQLQSALVAMRDDQMNGLATFQGALALLNRKIIIAFAAENRLPAVYQATLFAEAGGLMAWAPDLEEQFRVAARNVDKILKGAKPGDIPIQYPARYYLTINAGTAKKLGMTLPPALLAQADRVLS
jgi:putative ABC transport system substrate-binding protein